MEQIGLYGGSFDPLHFGHINLALEILEKSSLDKILFCPAFISPHKLKTPPKVSSEDRLQMLKLAIADIKNFDVYDGEIKRKGVSYTIDTLEELQEKYLNKAKISLVIAQDSLSYFCSWKDYKKIIEKFSILIGCRSNFSETEIPLELKNSATKNFITTKRLEISSTDIRERLKKELYCGHLMPAKVLDYIYAHKLY